jgi:phosphoglycolate phosphatase
MERDIVFFDIDGTLIDSRDSGRASFIRALELVFGWTDGIDYIKFTGATDLDVLDRIFTRYGKRLSEDDTGLFFAEMPRQLEMSFAANPPRVLPGVREVLEKLSACPEYIVGLVTGNIEPCARIKLAAAGIDHPFALGAFGHEHAERDEIARLALQRAEELLQPGDSVRRIVLIGDSPADVRAAKAIGAEALAVCTGHPCAEELAAAGADFVLEDLRDAASFFGLLNPA